MLTKKKSRFDTNAQTVMSHSPQPLVLITGGAGFIGSHTADELIRNGYRVRVLDCLDSQVHGKGETFPSYLHPQIECIRGDVRSAKDVQRALQGVSFVYHFAALTGVGQSMYDIKQYTDVNICGTANLIEIIVKNKLPIEKLVLSSSRAAYGEGTHDCPTCGIVYPPIRSLTDMQQNRFGVFCHECGHETSPVVTNENRPLTPISVYGWSKKTQEELCEYAANTFGIPVVILRYFNVYGSRQSLINPYTGIISIFFSRLMAAKSISIYEHGIPLRDFVHVFDVVRANFKALNSRSLPPCTILNIGTGIKTSIIDIAHALAQVTGKELQFEDHGEYRVGDIHACVADLARARSLLGYKPKITLKAGLQEFVAWAQSQHTVDSYQTMVENLKTFGLFNQTQ